jgi:cytochrome P450
VLQSLFSLPDDARRFDFARSVEAYISGPGQPSMVDALSRREDDFRALGFGRRRFGRLWRAKVEVLIEERLAKGEPDDRPGDLLDRLLAARDPETGEGLTRARVRDEASTLLAAGFETTARLLGWAAYLLALDPATQDAIRAEVRMAPAGTAASLADLSRWPRLRAALFETLRLYPPAFAIAEAQILMASLVGRYRFWLAEDRPVMPVGGVTIRPDHQPLFRLEPLD